jgi:hypothetical protein
VFSPSPAVFASPALLGGQGALCCWISRTWRYRVLRTGAVALRRHDSYWLTDFRFGKYNTGTGWVPVPIPRLSED